MTNLGKNTKVIEQADHGGFKIEVIEYSSLEGSRDIAVSQALFFANQAGIRLKMVRITLVESEAILEAGSLYMLKGRIDITSKAGGTGGIGGLAKGIATRVLTNETVFRPAYKGTGEIYLEPSFGHFLLYRLEAKQSLIVDKGMFYCCEGSVNVSVAMQSNLSAGVLGGEGLFQTKVAGPGICVLASPVPSSEVIFYDLNNEKLQVDGNFALMRTEGIRFSVQKSTKGIIGSMTSGEGLLQTFEGTGRVWVALTQAVYDQIRDPLALARMARSGGTSNTAVR